MHNLPSKNHTIKACIHCIKASIHRIKSFTYKSSKSTKFYEDFGQKRRGINPWWWRRWGTFIRNRWRQVLFMNPLTINILSVTKGGNHTSTNRNRLLYLNKGFIIQRNLEMKKKRVTRWEYERGALVRNVLCIRYLTKWAQLIWLSVRKAHMRIKSSSEAWARLDEWGNKMRTMM